MTTATPARATPSSTIPTIAYVCEADTKVFEAVPAKQQSMHADRGDQQHRRADRTTDRDEINRAHCAVKLGEPLLERQRQQEAGEQLDAGLRNPQLLQQAGPITVQPLRFGLVAVLVPLFLGLGMLDVAHAASLTVPALALARSAAFTRSSAAA